MPNSKLPPDMDATALQPPADPDRTQLLESTLAEDVGQRAPVEVNSVLLGRFKLVQLVGEGGMSDVYKAIDLRKVEAGARDPHLAVKVLTVRFDDFFSSLSVMHQEASKLQTLTHPNIVRVFDCDRDGQTVFMTMEYLDGTPLKFIIKKAANEGLPRAEAMLIIDSMVAALEFAHAKNIVHGDLKPGNVIVTKSGEVKVIDFGIARFLRKQDDGPQDHLPGPYLAFTPLYSSPETFDRAEPDIGDDVYSLACIAHELLTGTHPFNRVSSHDARATQMQIARSPKLKAHEHRAIVNALRFDRAERTPGARQFLDELKGTRQRSVRQIAGWTAIAIAALVGMLFMGRLLTGGPPKPVALNPGQVFRDCPTCPLMVVLKPGEFRQGSPVDLAGVTPFELPAHDVHIAYPLAAGVNEVTVGEFAEFAKDSPRAADGCMIYDGDWTLKVATDWRNATATQTSSHPVTCVSFQDATDYATWLSTRTGATYRLPSASEWEYMARGGTNDLPWNDPADACNSANVADASAAQRYPGWTAFGCNDNFVQSAPVGTFAANAFGLNDTLGNVFEWVQDCWRDDYTDAPTDGAAVSQGDCAQREARGGSWFTTPAFIRAAYRNRFDADYHGNALGFRVVREIRNEK